MAKLLDEEKSRLIEIALEEYRVLEQEKQVYIQGGLAVPSIVVLGTATGISIVAQFEQWWILIALPLAQIGILAFSLFASAMSLRHGMYLAVVEKRIERIAGQKLIGWETRGVENWPKFQPGGKSIENKIPNVGISLYFFIVLVFVAIETGFSARWYWNSGFPEGNDQELIRHSVAAVYVALNVVCGSMLLHYFLSMPKWASELHSRFAWEEIAFRYVIDIFDGHIDPKKLEISGDDPCLIHVRNLTRAHRVFVSDQLHEPKHIAPGGSCEIRITSPLPGKYLCHCEHNDTEIQGEAASIEIVKKEIGPDESVASSAILNDEAI